MREGKNKNIYEYKLVMFKFLLLMKVKRKLSLKILFKTNFCL